MSEPRSRSAQSIWGALRDHRDINEEGEALLLAKAKREVLWRQATEAVESYIERVGDMRVAPELDPQKFRAILKSFDFEKSMDPTDAVEFVVGGLSEYQTHAPHPRYYGLFNPATTAMGIVADMLVAAFNPQLAAWSHSPLAIEIEQHLIRAFGEKFGFFPSRAEGSFTNAGAEANHTAVLAALINKFPDYAKKGVRGLDSQPVLYVSSESHHSILKAARISGIGTEAVREVSVDEDLRLIPSALETRIRKDRKKGFTPFLIVATVGTTNAGAIDPLIPLADIAAKNRIWLHADAAWGGAAALVPELRPLLDGIELADSITFDAHKWLSVPMAAGLFITRHAGLLEKTFRIENVYMPREAAGLDVVDPYAVSIQWSRRFIGLKVFLSLVVAGWAGYEETIRHQTAMGARLREGLLSGGWGVVNRTPLPLVCFVDDGFPKGKSFEYLDAVVKTIVSSGKAWISTTRVGAGQPVIRACITNFRTEKEDIEALVYDLDWARKKVREK